MGEVSKAYEVYKVYKAYEVYKVFNNLQRLYKGVSASLTSL